MNCILALLITLTIFGSSYCEADTISKDALIPWVPGKCHHDKKIYPPGEHQLPDCTRLICSSRGWASVHNCIDYSIKGCIRGEVIDINLSFPDCCKRTYTCQHEDGSEYSVTNY